MSPDGCPSSPSCTPTRRLSGIPTTWPSGTVSPSPRRSAVTSSRDGNRHLSEKQIGGAYTNAEIVSNPVNIPYDVSLAWPSLGPAGELRFACVGRLYPPAKGQDLLIEALAGPLWKDRAWKLYVYGSGDMQLGLEWLAGKLGIADRIVFPGFARVEDIWAANHVLVMPSRFEGLPLAMVEAMLCARPVIATDIAGHREVIEDGVTGFLADAPAAGEHDPRHWSDSGSGAGMPKQSARQARGGSASSFHRIPLREFSGKLQRLAGVGA